MQSQSSPVSNHVPSFAGRRILVVGDAILDRYWFGAAQRLSREAPIPVIVSKHKSSRCGGAANAAANVASLGGSVTLLALCGEDREAEDLAGCCQEAGIELCQIKQPQATATKLRILAQNQQMLRVDSDPDFTESAAKVAAEAVKIAGDYDAVLLSDYGLGTLAACAEIIKQVKVPVIVDPRGGDWSRYKGAHLLTPNQAEFAAAGQGKNANELMSAFDLQAILLTQGSEGMQLHQRDSDPHTLPTHASEVFDVTGAGDTVCATMALGIAAGMDLTECMRWANTAAGIAVGQLGTVAVAASELSAPPGGHSGRILAAEDLAAHISELKAAGKKIVMTNGCFDILHAGHLASLTSAANLGDILLVAVNDDASVASLKGDSRPVITLAERMQLLAGLGCVDVVTSFGGPEATELVKIVKPDVYAKGGDWQDKHPPEAQAASNNGAEIVYLGVVDGLSTTNIVDKVKQNG